MLVPMIRNNFTDGFFDNLFGDFLMPAGKSGNSTHGGMLMKTDIKSTENGFTLDIDLPGFSRENVKAQLKDGYLTVSAETKSDNDSKDEEGRFIRKERYFESCSRSYYVGDELTEEDIKAKFENGTLHIDLPKKEPAKQIEEEKYISIA